jgi:hypothetical protein
MMTPRSTNDQKTEWDSLISDYPPDPPPIDRFTKILFKICCGLLVMVGIAFFLTRNQVTPEPTIVEATILPESPSSPRKFGFPTVEEFEKRVEPAQKPVAKVVTKPKLKPKAKIASKKPVKKAKRQRMISSR